MYHVIVKCVGDDASYAVAAPITLMKQGMCSDQGEQFRKVAHHPHFSREVFAKNRCIGDYNFEISRAYEVI